MKNTLRWIGIVVAALFILIQFGQPDRTNPPVDQSVTIAAHSEFSQPVSGLVRTACFDCHSNETRWPWYSYVAPVSWLVCSDVAKGRRHLNFSEWETYPKSKRVLKLGQIYEQVSKGDMPIEKYLYIHTDAKLSAADRDSITAWTERLRDNLTE